MPRGGHGHGAHGHGAHGHGGRRGHGYRRGWGGYFDTSPVVYYPWPVYDPWLVPDPWPAVVLADPSQVLDPLFDPAQMVDLSQGVDLSRLDQSQARNFGRLPSLLPGPSVLGFHGLFEEDFRVVGGESLPRRRGLLILSQKNVRKAWKPRRLAVSRAPTAIAP